jgi:hypothetical protein
MSIVGPTWVVMVRDVSHAVKVSGQSQIMACLVVDRDTGLARGAWAAPTSSEACAEAVRSALTKPAGPLPPQPPDRVLCGSDEAAELFAGLRLLDEIAPTVPEVAAVGEAEDVFDSFVGHMAGRRQPDEFPTPTDWQLLIGRSSDFCRVRPWLRWSDIDHVDLVVRVGGAARYIAVVIGQEGIQRGLVLYPGAVVPEGLRDREPGVAVPMPTGTLLFWLDPPDEVPPEFAAKAARYGWPAQADLLPIWLVGGPDGPADLDRTNALRLTVAIDGVLAHDQHRAASGNGGHTTTGQVTFADGQDGTFSIRAQP